MHKVARGSHPSAPTGSSVMRLAVGLRSGAELLVRNQAWAYQMLSREVVAASMPLLALCMLPWDTPADQICADASGVVHLANIAPAKRRSLSLQKKALRAASIRRLRPQVEGLSQMLTLALDDYGVVRMAVYSTHSGGIWGRQAKHWRARSRLYQSRFLQLNSKYSLESSRRGLHNALLCTALKPHFLPKFARIFCETTRILAKKMLIFQKNCEIC